MVIKVGSTLTKHLIIIQGFWQSPAVPTQPPYVSALPNLPWLIETCGNIIGNTRELLGTAETCRSK